MEVTGSGEGTVTPASAAAQAAGDGDTVTFVYEGEEAILEFTYHGGTGYLHSMQVTNALPETVVNEQQVMPDIMDYGDADSLEVVAAGQRLRLSQEGGSLSTGALSSDVAYYGFPAVAAYNRLEKDRPYILQRKRRKVDL